MWVSDLFPQSFLLALTGMNTLPPGVVESGPAAQCRRQMCEPKASIKYGEGKNPGVQGGSEMQEGASKLAWAIREDFLE